MKKNFKSLVRTIDKRVFKYGLSKCYRIARANLYVRSSYFLKQIPVSWIRSVDIEPIARCNLECPFCQVPGWHRATETEPMGIELFEKIIDQFPNLNHIKLQGMGEPFLNESLTTMIRMAGERKLKTTIITNGTLLERSLALDVLESGLTNLSFSFDAATKQTYESLKVGADFETVVSNIRNMCEMRNSGNYKTGIQIRCLVSNQAVLDELPALVGLASDVGVDQLYVVNRLKIWEAHDRATYPVECVPIDSYVNCRAAIRRAEINAKKRGFQLRIEQNRQHSTLHPCTTPWNTVFVSVDGKAVPCSHIGNPDTWCMGDLVDTDIRSVWNNPAYRTLRRSIQGNSVPSFCSTCYTYNRKRC